MAPGENEFDTPALQNMQYLEILEKVTQIMNLVITRLVPRQDASACREPLPTGAVLLHVSLGQPRVPDGDGLSVAISQTLSAVSSSLEAGMRAALPPESRSEGAHKAQVSLSRRQPTAAFHLSPPVLPGQ